MQFTFESSVSSNLGRLSKLDCFCPYLSVSVLDCVPLILFLWNGVQLPSITISFISSETYTYSYRLRKNALAYVLNRNYGILYASFIPGNTYTKCVYRKAVLICLIPIVAGVSNCDRCYHVYGGIAFFEGSAPKNEVKRRP